MGRAIPLFAVKTHGKKKSEEGRTPQLRKQTGNTVRRGLALLAVES
jgi:hypothetical protein